MGTKLPATRSVRLRSSSRAAPNARAGSIRRANSTGRRARSGCCAWWLAGRAALFRSRESFLQKLPPCERVHSGSNPVLDVRREFDSRLGALRRRVDPRIIAPRCPGISAGIWTQCSFRFGFSVNNINKIHYLRVRHARNDRTGHPLDLTDSSETGRLRSGVGEGNRTPDLQNHNLAL